MKAVKKGDKLSVSLSLEFDGTVDNHAIFVENTFLPTTNNSVKNKKILTDGDPIEVEARFKGVSGSKVIKFELTINGKSHTVCKDVKLKNGKQTIVMPIPYSKFDLKEPKL